MQSTVQTKDEHAAFSFIDKFINGYNSSINLKICALYDALYSLYLGENKKKTFIFYFHNDTSQFSKRFCTFLSHPDAESILNESFMVYGWDVGEDEYQNILIETLENVYKLEPCIEFVRSKRSVAIFIKPVEMSFDICHIMKDLSSFDDFRMVLENLVLFGEIEEDDSNEHVEDIDHSCEAFHQRMYESLGTRDYDRYEPNQLDSLRAKIAYALFGMPVEESGYGAKQEEETDKMYEIMLEVANEFSEYKNEVEMAIIFTCLVPLENRDSKEQYAPVPVFVLRKCKEADHPCRIFIDHTRRVYNCWQDYLEDNKFIKCLMVVPENGRYQGDESNEGNEIGKVRLQKLESPACRVGRKVLRGADITGTVLGLGSTGVLVAAAVPAIAVAPVALVGAAVVGAAVGVYSIGRSTATLIDRGKHKESINVTDSESRAAYINIGAGALGFAGAGANIAVSQLAAKGANIGMATRLTVNALGVANIGIGGLAIGNSAADIFMQWYLDDRKPSTLSILQLSTSILFFGHAVYNFKTAGTIIEENQTSVLQDMKDWLSSNKQRKMFNKMELETIRQNGGNLQKGRAEVISTILKMKSKDEAFAFLARSNKKFNEIGIKFAAQDGQVTLNGVSVDLVELSSMSQSDAYRFFTDLPSRPSSVRSSGGTRVNFDFSCDFSGIMNTTTANAVVNVVSTLIQPLSLQDKIFSILRLVIEYIGTYTRFNLLLNEMFPYDTKYLQVVNILFSFIRKCVGTLQSNYENDNIHDPHSFLFRYVGDLEDVDRKLLFTQTVCNDILLAFRYSAPSEILKKLLEHIEKWIISVCMQREEEEEQNVSFTKNNTQRVTCKKCSGYHFD